MTLLGSRRLEREKKTFDKKGWAKGCEIGTPVSEAKISKEKEELK